MSIIDKANEYVGHPKKMDESYTTSVRRDAYAQGYQDAVDKACEWLKEHYAPAGFVDGIFRKAMLEEE